MGGREYAKNVKKSKNLALLLCLGSFCFCAGMIFTNRYVFSIGFLLLSLNFQFLIIEVVDVTKLCLFCLVGISKLIELGGIL